MSPARICAGSPVRSNGRCVRVDVRRTNVCREHRSHTLIAPARISARVSASMKAPPPVASTQGGPDIRREITRLSPTRNSASPKRSKNSAMLQPDACSISASASRNGMPSRSARRRPTDVLPAPISPTITTLRESAPRMPVCSASGRSGSGSKLLRVIAGNASTRDRCHHNLPCSGPTGPALAQVSALIDAPHVL